MSKRLTQETIDARMEVYNEIINHLDQCWSDSATERNQGKIIAERLRREADRWYDSTDYPNRPSC